ncbi:MAG: hypothetical protein HY548_08580, partial [Elusimicrobia bacterium]|nr:hypothetical protein [Elusimicrobiota bacterium]
MAAKGGIDGVLGIGVNEDGQTQIAFSLDLGGGQIVQVQVRADQSLVISYSVNGDTKEVWGISANNSEGNHPTGFEVTTHFALEQGRIVALTDGSFGLVEGHALTAEQVETLNDKAEELGAKIVDLSFGRQSNEIVMTAVNSNGTAYFVGISAGSGLPSSPQSGRRVPAKMIDPNGDADLPGDSEEGSSNATVVFTTFYAINANGYLVQLPNKSWGFVSSTIITAERAAELNELRWVAGVALQRLSIDAVPTGERVPARDSGGEVVYDDNGQIVYEDVTVLQVVGILPLSQSVAERLLNYYKGDLEEALGLERGSLTSVQMADDGQTLVLTMKDGTVIRVDSHTLNNPISGSQNQSRADDLRGQGEGVDPSEVVDRDENANIVQGLSNLSWQGRVALSMMILLGGSPLPGTTANGEFAQNTSIDWNGATLSIGGGARANISLIHRDRKTGVSTQVGSLQVGIMGRGLTFAATWFHNGVTLEAAEKGQLRLRPPVQPRALPPTTNAQQPAPDNEQSGDYESRMEARENRGERVDDAPVEDQTQAQEPPPAPQLPSENPPMEPPANGTLEGSTTIGIVNGGTIFVASWTIFDSGGRKLVEYTRGVQEGKGAFANDRVYFDHDSRGLAGRYEERGWSDNGGFFIDNVTDIGYDANGRIYSFTSERRSNYDRNPVTNVRLASYYDAAGRLVRTDERRSWSGSGSNSGIPGLDDKYTGGQNVNVTTTFRYDALGRLSSMVAQASGGTFTSTPFNNVDGNNFQQTYSQYDIRYDRFGRISSYNSTTLGWTADPDDEANENGGRGRAEWESSPATNHTVNTYDAYGRISASVTAWRDGESWGRSVSRNEYNELGQVLRSNVWSRTDTESTYNETSKIVNYVYANGEFINTYDSNKTEESGGKGFWNSTFGMILGIIITVVVVVVVSIFTFGVG